MMKKNKRYDYSNLEGSIHKDILIIKELPMRILKDKSRKRAVLCKCKCGVIFETLAISVLRQTTTSCGCRRKDTLHSLAKHGLRHHKLYSTWLNMKDRCYNPKNQNWKDYGGRGIKVCDRWKESFVYFLQDMGPKPSKKHSIDRIDVNGNYESSNCRWVTQKEQMSNTRFNYNITYLDETMCLTAWANRYELNFWTLKNRIKSGWDIEKALTYPVNKKK